MDATAPVTDPAATAAPASATASAPQVTILSLPEPVVQALGDKARDDPVLRSLVDRIIAGSASHQDNFQFLLVINQITLDEFARGQQRQADMQKGSRRPRTRCRN